MRGRCNPVNRWGPGTTCERPSNSEAAKDLQAKMAAIQAERDKQDLIWIQDDPKLEKDDIKKKSSNK